MDGFRSILIHNTDPWMDNGKIGRIDEKKDG